MRHFLLALSFLAAGCASGGGIAPDAGERAANFVACNLALASAGMSISQGGDPQVAMATIAAVSKDPAIAKACASVAAGLAQDLEAAKSLKK